MDNKLFFGKRILFFLIFTLLISNVQCNVFAEPSMNINGTKFLKYDGDEKEVIIPEGITEIGRFAFERYEYQLDTVPESITIPESVTTIEEGAFKGCKALKEIKIDSRNKIFTFKDGILINTVTHEIIACMPAQQIENYIVPNEIEKIANYAFESCDNLNSITLSPNTKIVGSFVFQGCINFKKILVPQANPTFSEDNGVLTNKAKTELLLYPMGRVESSYTIPKKITAIREYAFSQSSKLKDVVTHNDIKSMENGAFDDCTSLESIQIPQSITKIEPSLFYGCISLKSISFGPNVKLIYEDALDNCDSLTEILVDKNNTAYKSVEGILYNKAGDKLLVCPDGKVSKNLVIPSGTLIIETRSFFDCKKVSGVTFPHGLKEIGRAAFYGCSNLGDITLPNTVTKIGYIAFDYCPKIKKVIIPNSVTEIDDLVFTRNEDLTIYTNNYYAKTYAEINVIKVNYQETKDSKVLVKAVPSNNKIYVNGKALELPAYNIENENHVRLRDVAFALKDTELELNVLKDGRTYIMGQSYKPIGGELAPVSKKWVMANKVYSKIDDLDYNAETNAYQIMNEYFFPVRYLAGQLGFKITYNAETNTINFDTAKTF